MGIFDSLGGILGGGAEEDAARKNRRDLAAYGDTAEETAARFDPYAKKRDTYSSLLFNRMTDPSSMVEDPGYQFRFSEGMRATERGMAAKGYNQSGNVLAALQERGQGLASQEYGSIIDRLAKLGGAPSDASLQNAGQAYSGIRETAVTGVASSRVAEAAAKASGLGALGSLAGTVIGGIYGGPGGAAAGGAIGGSIGGGSGTQLRPAGGQTNLFQSGY